MRCRFSLLLILTLGGCSHASKTQQRDRDSAAFKLGAAAHEIANEAEKTAAAAERGLEESARKAKQGWQQREREDREKAGQNH